MITVGDMAKLVNGSVVGDAKTPITGMAPVDRAKEGDITFAFDEESFKRSVASKAACILTTEEIKGSPKTLLRVGDIKEAVAVLYNAIMEIRPPVKGGIHPSAVISDKAALGSNVFIGAHVVISDSVRVGDNSFIEANCVIKENVTIGQNVHLCPNVTVYDGTVIGNKVLVHAGSVIGSDGFGFLPKGDKVYKVPQMGNVVIEDDVEIGSNVCIDRATFGSTVLKKGVKLDNLIQIAHNVTLGRNVLVAGLSGIAGSTVIGDGTMIGAGCGISDHTRLGRNSKVGGMSGVTGNNPDNKVFFGYPAREASDFKKLYAIETLLIRHYKKLKEFLHGLAEK